MTTKLGSLLAALPVAWARIYTLGLATDEREWRVAQIRSDVHEQLTLDGGAGQFELLARLAVGAWDDITWRFQRGHRARMRIMLAGRTPFPGFAAAAMATAGLAAALRISMEHGLPREEWLGFVLALLAGPLVSVLGVLVARTSPVTGLAALAAGSAALAIVGWETVVAPIAAVAGFAAGLYFVAETRTAARIQSEQGRSASPASPTSSDPFPTEDIMERSDRLERWLPLGALLVLIALAGRFYHDVNFPFEGSDAEILAWYDAGHETEIYGLYFAVMAGGIGTLLFYGGLYGALRRAEGGPGIAAALMLAAGAAAAVIAMVAVSVTSSIGMANVYDDEFNAGGIDPQMVRVFSASGFAFLAMQGAAHAVAAGTIAVVALRTGRIFAPWLAWATAAVAGLQLLNFPLFGMPHTLLVVWMLVVAGSTLVRGTSYQPAAHGPSPVTS